MSEYLDVLVLDGNLVFDITPLDFQIVFQNPVRRRSPTGHFLTKL